MRGLATEGAPKAIGYGEAFGAHAPARATVQVTALPRGARVEIECVAVRRT